MGLINSAIISHFDDKIRWHTKSEKKPSVELEKEQWSDLVTKKVVVMFGMNPRKLPADGLRKE